MDSTVTWLRPPDSLTLISGELHIWRAPLHASADSLVRSSTLLSPEEGARAGRFVVARDRQHFTVARATLRLLLGGYLQAPPESLRIESGAQNKPFLVENSGPSELRFNLSHSHGLALFAFAMQQDLGIDVERLRPGFASRDIAQRYFSQPEVAELDALPPSLFTMGFFQCWTRKEAYIKARGQGLQIPLDSFSVTLTPGRPAGLTSSDADCWSMYSFRPSEEYVAAVVAERLEWRLSFYDASGLA